MQGFVKNPDKYFTIIQTLYTDKFDYTTNLITRQILLIVKTVDFVGKRG